MNRMYIWRIVVFVGGLTAFLLAAGMPRGFGT